MPSKFSDFNQQNNFQSSFQDISYQPNFTLNLDKKTKPKQNFNFKKLSLFVGLIFEIFDFAVDFVLFNLYRFFGFIFTTFTRLINDFSKAIHESILAISKKQTRGLWILNFKLEILNFFHNLKEILFYSIKLAKSLYLIFIVLSIIVFSSLANKYQNSSNSSITKFLNSYTLKENPSLVIDTRKLVALSTLSETKKSPLLERVIKYETKTSDTLASVAEMYGINAETLAFNNKITETTELPKTLYIPWSNGFIYQAQEDISAEELEEIYKIDKKLIYSENEGIFDQAKGKFAKGNYIYLPTSDYTAVTKNQELAKAKKEEEEQAKNLRLARNNGNTYLATNTNIASLNTNARNSGFIWPTKGIISRCVVPYHVACDIADPNNPPIWAAKNATVAAVYRFTVVGYGLAVLLDHGNGMQTLYAHMSEIYVSPGQTVTQGQTIGKMGCTGMCYGTHLHFEIRVNGVNQDPLRYLP
jgi:murein DD-endopeptidase MepM/ murein hydrolase activator NlpD